MVLLKAVCNFEREKNAKKFCDVNGIRYKAMIEIRKLRQQLTNIGKFIFTVILKREYGLNWIY